MQKRWTIHKNNFPKLKTRGIVHKEKIPSAKKVIP
jgi:hypothetical protein